MPRNQSHITFGLLTLPLFVLLFIVTSCASPTVAKRETQMSDGRPPCLSIRDGDFGIEVDTMVMKIHSDSGVRSLLLSDGPPIACKSLAIVERAAVSSVKIVFQMPNRKTGKVDEMMGVASLIDARWTMLPRIVAVKLPGALPVPAKRQTPKKQKANSVRGDGL